jgi:tripartite-type tricarboxylate transporter receptor subunit TctC
MHRLLRHLALAVTSSTRQTNQTVESADSAYPTRPIRMVVGHLRNAAIDPVARAFTGKLAAELGQPLVIDTSARVGGTLGLAVAARATPDGYTLLMTSTATTWVARHLYNKLPHDPSGDFAPVALFSLLPEGLAAAKLSAPTSDLHRRIEWLKKCGAKVDGIYAPPGTAGAIVDKLAVAIRRATRAADVRTQLAKQSVDLVLLTGPAVRAFLGQDDESRAMRSA